MAKKESRFQKLPAREIMCRCVQVIVRRKRHDRGSTNTKSTDVLHRLSMVPGFAGNDNRIA